MRRMHGCPENFREALTTLTTFFQKKLWAFVRMDPLNVLAKFEIRSFPVPEIIGGTRKMGSPWILRNVKNYGFQIWAV